MLKYKANINAIHPSNKKKCNSFSTDKYEIYDSYNYGNTDKLCSLNNTIDKSIKVLDMINHGKLTIDSACTTHCLDIFLKRNSI